jgi:hypothetical protein
VHVREHASQSWCSRKSPAGRASQSDASQVLAAHVPCFCRSFGLWGSACTRAAAIGSASLVGKVLCFGQRGAPQLATQIGGRRAADPALADWAQCPASVGVRCWVLTCSLYATYHPLRPPLWSMFPD